MLRNLWNRWPIAFLPVFMVAAVLSVVVAQDINLLAFACLVINCMLALGCFARQVWLDEQESKAGRS